MARVIHPVSSAKAAATDGGPSEQIEALRPGLQAAIEGRRGML